MYLHECIKVEIIRDEENRIRNYKAITKTRNNIVRSGNRDVNEFCKTRKVIKMTIKVIFNKTHTYVNNII